MVYWDYLAALVSTLDGDVAVRSSAVDEDGVSSSFAGIHETFLHRRHVDDVIAAVIAVQRSARSEAALAYRRRHGLSAEPVIAVVLQQMVRPRISGVLFTRDPVHGHDVRVIEASWGLGEAVVAGMVEPDRVHLGRDGAVARHVVGRKDIELVHQDGGVGERAVPADRRDAPCLDVEALQALHGLAADVERVFHDGVAHDVEFAFDHDGRLWLLQRREVTR
jgi:pyruvate,water dikinase